MLKLKKKREKKAFYFFFIIFFFSLILIIFPRNIEKNINDDFLDDKNTKRNTYKLTFVGDIMLDRGVRYMVEKRGEGNYKFPFLKIKEFIEDSDILFGNLESVISNKGKKIGSIYSFRSDILALEGLSYAGFDIVSLANNHAFDYEREAFEDTLSRLTENGILYTGAGFNKKEAHLPSIITINDDYKVGFLGYTEFLYPNAFAGNNISGITTLSEEGLERDIKRAKDFVDFLVITFHYGDEYEKKQNKKQERLSKLAVEFGADIVIGHHPHVSQPFEIYKGKYIFYSLGNFVFDQYFSEETMSGFMVELIIEDKEIKLINKINYKINEYYQVEFKNREKIF